MCFTHTVWIIQIGVNVSIYPSTYLSAEHMYDGMRLGTYICDWAHIDGSICWNAIGHTSILTRAHCVFRRHCRRRSRCCCRRGCVPRESLGLPAGNGRRIQATGSWPAQHLQKDERTPSCVVTKVKQTQLKLWDNIYTRPFHGVEVESNDDFLCFAPAPQCTSSWRCFEHTVVCVRGNKRCVEAAVQCKQQQLEFSKEGDGGRCACCCKRSNRWDARACRWLPSPADVDSAIGVGSSCARVAALH